MEKKAVNKKTWIIAGVVAVLLAVLGVGGFVISRGSSNREPDLLELGQRYLDELNYEQAIACFEEYLEIDPQSVEAYTGLAQAYAGLRDYEKALEVLADGYAATGDSSLLELSSEIEAQYGEILSAGKNEEEGQETEVPEETAEPEEGVAYAERKNLQFSEPTDLSLPAFPYVFYGGIIFDADGERYEHDHVTENAQIKVRDDIPCEYSFEYVDRSEPDADGNVVYTILWKVKCTIGVDILSRPSYDIMLNSDVASWGLFDYYTGTSLLPEENTTRELDIVWGDATYHFSDDYSTAGLPFDWSVMDPDTYVEAVGGKEFCHMITVPADYDGLVLYINEEGYTKKHYEEGDENDNFGTVLDLEGADHFIFIRVDDCLQ